jgi:hypothetical protein
MDWASHLVNDLFTNGEAKPGASLVAYYILIELLKIYEQIINSLLGDPISIVLNFDSKIDTG